MPHARPKESRNSACEQGPERPAPRGQESLKRGGKVGRRRETVSRFLGECFQTDRSQSRWDAAAIQKSGIKLHFAGLMQYGTLIFAR